MATRLLKVCVLMAAIVAGLFLCGAHEANAQWGPAVTYYDMWGNPHYVYPSRLQPGANIPIWGSQQQFSRYVPGVGWVYGTRYLGIDGRWHGDTHVTTPGGTSTSHYFYAPRNTSGRR